MSLSEFCAWGRRFELFAAKPEEPASRVLRVWHPAGQEVEGSFTDVWIGLEHGGLITRMVQRYVDAREPRSSFDHETRIVRWKSIGEGLMFPIEIERVIRRNGSDPVIRNRWVVDEERLIVNRDVPPEALDFRFPKNALVRFSPPEDGRYRVELWGENNESVKRIRSPEDLREFFAKHQPKGSFGSAWVWGLGAIVAIGALWVLLRRRSHGR
jgi:hypothetical protein